MGPVVMLINSTWLNAFAGGIFQGEYREAGFISLFPLHQLSVHGAVSPEWFLPWEEVGPWGGWKVGPLINQKLQQDGTYEGTLAGDSFLRPFLCAKEIIPKCDLV